MEKGKLFKVAITACMRKMLTIMNAMTHDQVLWRPSIPVSLNFFLDFYHSYCEERS